MKRKPKAPIFLVIAISLFLPLLSAYVNYYVLSEADFLSAYPKYENADLFSVLLLKKEKFTGLTGFSYAFWVANDLIGYLSNIYLPITFPQVKTLVLRC